MKFLGINILISLVISVYIWITKMDYISFLLGQPTYMTPLLSAEGTIFLRLLLFIAASAIYFYVSRVGAKSVAMLSHHDYAELQTGLVSGCAVAAFILSLIAAFIVAFSHAVPDDTGYLMSVVLNLTGIVSMFVKLIFVFVLAPIFILSYIIAFMYFLIGIYSFFVSSTSAKVAKKHVKVKRPTDIVQKELSAAVQSGLKSDIQIREIIDELPAPLRFLQTIKYKLKAQKYRKVRKLAEAQSEAIGDRVALGDAAINLERSRRATQKLCGICRGSGKLTTDKKTVTCSMCDGLGYL
jgi:hypothetical protein